MSQKIKSFWVFLLLASGVSSCCTKKDCDLYYPPVQIKIKNSDLYGAMTILQFNKIKQRLDSIKVDRFDYWPRDAYYEYGQYSYNLYFKRNNVIVDSVLNFNFRWEETKISCNSCFPFGKDSQTAKKLVDFSYTQNGKTFGLYDAISVAE